LKLALMQPYFFPYLGYFQIISACDLFVIYDDVQFIKGGWINRNRILINGEAQYITLPLEKDHLSKKINERRFTTGFEREKEAIRRKLEAAYREAPFYADTMAMVRGCFDCKERNVAGFLTNVLTLCCRHLQIATPIRLASELPRNSDGRGEERVIEINKALGADHYINPPGGKELYNKQTFANAGITLSFLQPREIRYSQGAGNFMPWLSILDVLMFNSIEDTRTMLGSYDLV
jgi:hypothetical protein